MWALCKRGNGNRSKNSFTHEHKSREHLLMSISLVNIYSHLL